MNEQNLDVHVWNFTAFKGNLNGYLPLIILIPNFYCYWDGIVRNFLYFFCRQLTDFFANGAWLPTKIFYANPHLPH